VFLVQAHRGVRGGPAPRAEETPGVAFQDWKAQAACLVRAEPHLMPYDLPHEGRVPYAEGEGNRVRTDLEEGYTSGADRCFWYNTFVFSGAVGLSRY
jgi:hypothetical protein